MWKNNKVCLNQITFIRKQFNVQFRFDCYKPRPRASWYIFLNMKWTIPLNPNKFQSYQNLTPPGTFRAYTKQIKKLIKRRTQNLVDNASNHWINLISQSDTPSEINFYQCHGIQWNCPTRHPIHAASGQSYWRASAVLYQLCLDTCCWFFPYFHPQKLNSRFNVYYFKKLD